MMKAMMLLCIVAVILMAGEARSPQGVVYPFPIDSVLQCRVPDPHVPGQINEVPTPTVPLIPNHPDQVWLPEEIRFRPPRGALDTSWLLPLLDFIEGVHILDCDDRNQTIRNSEITILGSEELPPGTDVIAISENQLAGLGFTVTEQSAIRRFWNRLGFAGDGCDDAIYEITRLPDYYYPPCYVGGRCSGESCSLPEGKRCMPSTRNAVELPVFRWDCCWDYSGAVWRWACGWYLVNIPIVTQCYCTCCAVF